MSSSGSWSGGGGRAADIIDLDKFMRGGVRPSSDRLVVDNGGPKLKVSALSSKSGLSSKSSSVVSPRGKHQKRFSHDSGLSDASYARQRPRPHRRVSGADGANHHRAPRDLGTAKMQHSSSSLRAFRAVCERALLDQQRQIARVAQLCERLTFQQKEPRVERPTERGDLSTTADTSDLSSSSKSTKDQRRKEKHRTQECKTYKIIMNKLDELNRLFATRGRSPLPRPVALRRATPSSGSVTVSDKIVATEPDLKQTPAKYIITRTQPLRMVDTQARQLVERAVGSGSGSPRESTRDSALNSMRSTRVSGLRAVTKAYAFDISPKEALNSSQKRERPNVVTESIIKREYSTDESHSSKCDPRCGFDLNDPVHLYAQAKRLQTLHASTRRRAHSADGSPFVTKLGDREQEHRRDSSLCALCRCYWRSIRNFLTGQLFCCPDNYKYS